MRKSWLKLITAAVFASTCLVGMAEAYAQDTASDTRISINLKDADLIVAAQALIKDTGLQFVVEPSSVPFEKVTLTLKDQPLDLVIRYICQAAGATCRRDESGVYIFSNRKADDNSNAAPVAEPPTKAPKIVKKLKLMHADPEAVYYQIVYQAKDDGSRVFSRMATNHMLRRARSIKDPVLAAINASQARPVALNSVSAPVTGPESGSDIKLPGEEPAGQMMGGGMGGGRMGGGGFQGGGGMMGGGMMGGGMMGGGGFQGGGGGLGGGIMGGQGGQVGGQGIFGPDIDYISYDPVDNSIVVRGPSDQIEELRRWVDTFDVAPQQVIIKVEFITTSNSVQKALGYDWLYQRGNLFLGNRPGSFARSGDPFVVSYATGNVSARLRVLLQEGYGKVVNAPIVRTLNNQYAEVYETIDTWIFTATVNSTGTQVVTSYEANQQTLDTGLSVTPRINQDGTIVMYLNPQISDFGETRKSPDGAEYQDTLTQYVSIVARVKNGETIVLGGLTRKSDTGTNQKFPVLGDLPLIGQFFRAANRTITNSELLIFVTPTIVSDEDNGGLGP